MENWISEKEGPNDLVRDRHKKKSGKSPKSSVVSVVCCDGEWTNECRKSENGERKRQRKMIPGQSDEDA